MRMCAPFLMHQLARFGALTTRQMIILCQGQAKKSAVYATLRELADLGLAEGVRHPRVFKCGFRSTQKNYAAVYGEDHFRSSGAREKDLLHALLCSNALIKLCSYANVSGIATEYELDPHDLSVFSLKKTPDAIVQLTQGNTKFELAVEVEASSKNSRDTDRLLSAYEQTFSRRMQCRGLLIVATEPGIHKKYLERVSKMPKEIESRILIIRDSGLDALDAEFFGPTGEAPYSCLETRRSSSAGVVEYLPVVSRSIGEFRAFKGPHLEGQSDISRRSFDHDKVGGADARSIPFGELCAQEGGSG
jgi:hypothetical protein